MTHPTLSFDRVSEYKYEKGKGKRKGLCFFLNSIEIMKFKEMQEREMVHFFL